MKLDNKGHTPDGIAILLMMPLLIAIGNFPGIIISWMLILWVPISLILILKRRSK